MKHSTSLIVPLLLAQSLLPAAAHAAAWDGRPVQDPASVAGWQEATLQAANDLRLQTGCEPLRLDQRLSDAAAAQADVMASTGTVEHDGPDGSSVSDRVSATGYDWSVVGEVLAAGAHDPGDAMAMWAQSPDHLEILTDCRFSEVGFGVRYVADDSSTGGGGPYFTYWAGVLAHDMAQVPMPLRSEGPLARALRDGLVNANTPEDTAVLSGQRQGNDRANEPVGPQIPPAH